MLDEGPISQFLEEQREVDGAVVSWSYMSPSMNYILRKMKPFWYDKNIFMDFAGYKEYPTELYTVEENYMEDID